MAGRGHQFVHPVLQRPFFPLRLALGSRRITSIGSFSHASANWGLLLANGQWDSQLEMVVNAFIHAAAIGWSAGSWAALMGRKNWPLIWLLPHGLPGAAIRLGKHLVGIPIAVLLPVDFSRCSRSGWLGLSEPLSLSLVGWVWLRPCAGCFTMASGFLAADAVVVLVLLGMFETPARVAAAPANLGRVCGNHHCLVCC